MDDVRPAFYSQTLDGAADWIRKAAMTSTGDIMGNGAPRYETTVFHIEVIRE